ncbi:MAG: hypothetical protein ACXVBZ_15570, partial [Flavisolibacter sp.]
MKNIAVAILLLCLGVSCSKNDKDSPCGQSMRHQIMKEPLYEKTNPRCLQLDKADPQFDTYLEGNNRVFSWSDLVENVCTDQHVFVYCKVWTLKDPSMVLARGAIWTSAVLQPARINMLQSGNEIKGQNEEGLKQVYGDGPGKFVPVVEVIFPTKGSFFADSIYFFQEVNYVEVISDYYAFKS